MIRTVPYRYELREFQEGMWLMVREAWERRLRQLAWIGVAGIAAGTLGFVVAPQQWGIALSALSLGLIASCYYLFRIRVAHLLASKMLRSPRNALLRSEHTAEFSKQGFVGTSRPGGRSDLEWDAFVGWKRGKLVTVLMTHESSGIVVSHRAFSGPGDVESMHDLLRSKLGAPSH